MTTTQRTRYFCHCVLPTIGAPWGVIVALRQLSVMAKMEVFLGTHGAHSAVRKAYTGTAWVVHCIN